MKQFEKVISPFGWTAHDENIFKVWRGVSRGQQCTRRLLRRYILTAFLWDFTFGPCPGCVAPCSGSAPAVWTAGICPSSRPPRTTAPLPLSEEARSLKNSVACFFTTYYHYLLYIFTYARTQQLPLQTNHQNPKTVFEQSQGLPCPLINNQNYVLRSHVIRITTEPSPWRRNKLPLLV